MCRTAFTGVRDFEKLWFENIKKKLLDLKKMGKKMAALKN